MSEIFLPLALAFGGLLAALMAYRDVRRGGARFYTLEREAILRRAGFTLLGAAVLFVGAVGWLAYDHQQLLNEEAAASGEMIDGVPTPTATPFVETFPPEATETPTPDASLPTPTSTPIICRAVVDGTFGNGLTLRDVPNGVEMDILADGSVLTMLTDEPAQESGGFTWVKVRTLFGEEGWVAQQSIQTSAACGG